MENIINYGYQFNFFNGIGDKGKKRIGFDIWVLGLRGQIIMLFNGNEEK